MHRLSGALVAFVVLVLTIAVAGATAGGGGVSDLGSTAPSVDTSSAIVQLNGDPLSTDVKTKPAPGKKINFSSDTVKSYRAQLSALRNDFKAWLKANAPAANVTGEYDISLNAVAVRLNGVSLGAIASAPMVKKAQYEGLYRPLDADPDLALIGIPAAWGGGGAAGAGVKPDGSRVKVGIIDTGIDVRHPCFSDAGFPNTPKQGPPSLTNNKVVVAKVFNNQSNRFGYTPEAIQDHGTHVAGTVACDYGLTNSTTSVNGVTVPYGVTGVAPGAQLGNYNVFPGEDGNARSEDILNALDAAYADGMDIVNMSLGGGAHGVQDLLTDAVDDLDQAGMISAVAAGNSGPGHFTVESPGSAARALTAGASTVGHFIGSPVTANGETRGAAAGDFATVSSDFPGRIVAFKAGTALSQGCSALPAVPTSDPTIGVVARGTCSFSIKIRNAQAAGADAVLVVNNSNGDPVAMAQDGTPNQPTVPAYMLSIADTTWIVAADGTAGMIGASKQYFNTDNDDFMANFSSQGPTDVDFRVKPDVVAPGVNVLSSVPAAFCAAPPCWAFFQGTSMATPHLAGSAAVVLGQHPGWSSAAVRSAVVNTAQENTLKKAIGTGLQLDPLVTGTGRERLDNAVNAAVALDPVSLSFGAVPSGSGQSKTGTIALTSLSGLATWTVSIGASTGTGVTYTANIVGGNIVVGMSAAKTASKGDHSAMLRLMRNGTEVAHAIVYTLIK
jgi:minor extracellular serine protease Vpr